MPQQKTEFRNDSGGVIGVVTIEPGGKEVALPVREGETIWLSEDEQIATANSHREDADNPFINGHLTTITNPEDVKNRRPIGQPGPAREPEDAERQRQEAKARQEQKVAEDEAQLKEEEARLEAGRQQAAAGAQPPAPKTPPSRQTAEETAAPKQSQGTPAQGSRAQGEEVGTPGAVEKT